MTFLEKKGDLFTVSRDFTLYHCISADCKMGAGIAKTFAELYPEMRPDLQSRWPEPGDALLYKSEDLWDVVNLVTKWRYFHKPSYQSVKAALEDSLRHDVQRVAMPHVGCGLDGLKWDKVRPIVQQTLHGTNRTVLAFKK